MQLVGVMVKEDQNSGSLLGFLRETPSLSPRLESKKAFIYEDAQHQHFVIFIIIRVSQLHF